MTVSATEIAKTMGLRLFISGGVTGQSFQQFSFNFHQHEIEVFVYDFELGDCGRSQEDIAWEKAAEQLFLDMSKLMKK